MIDTNIIKIAADDKFNGLLDNSNLRALKKNPLCGDKIIIEIIKQKNIIKTMRYETESCILCEASASLLANKIQNFCVKDLKKYFDNFKNIKRDKKIYLPTRFKEFNNLLNNKTLNRINCVILPMEALLKAFKLNR